VSKYCPLIKKPCRWDDCVLVGNPKEDEFCDFQTFLVSGGSIWNDLQVIVDKLERIGDALDNIEKGVARYHKLLAGGGGVR